MASPRTLVILANSYKHGGRCVAGREYAAGRLGPWVRPVSPRPGQALDEHERQLKGAAEPRVLELVRIGSTEPTPRDYQSENHLLKTSEPWVRLGRVSYESLEPDLEWPPGALWLDGHSSSKGLNDRVPVEEALRFDRSLYLIRPTSLVLVARREEAQLRVRAELSFQGVSYGLKVTDPVASSLLRHRGASELPVSECVLCISLSEPFKGSAYKLVAAVITPRPLGR